MARWYNYTVQCHECGVSTEEVLKQVKPLQAKNERILDMFRAVGLVSKPGKYFMIDKIYGKGNDKAFGVFWARSANHIKSKLNGYVPRDVYKSLVSNECKTRMAKANELVGEYFTNIKDISAQWNTRVVDECDVNADGNLVCSHCGSSNVKMVDVFYRRHTGITKQELKDENYTYGFKDVEYDDVEVYEDYSEYTKQIDRDKAEAEFFDLCAHYPIHVVTKKLGYKKYMSIIDIISDYYGAVL